MLEQFFDSVQIYFIINLMLCAVVGFSIGVERESRHKDAGISTHTLVIMGAMLFTYLSVAIDPEAPSRIAAQVVTGIGFLGAGLILKDGTSVRNLTTAASLWFAAGIGMSFGFGLYVIGLAAAIAAVFVPRIPHVLEKEKSPTK